MSWIHRFSLVFLTLGSFAFAQGIQFRADAITISPEDLQTGKCVQIGLYVTNTGKEATSWAQITATLTYVDSDSYINGTPFVKVTDFSSNPNGGIANPGVILMNNGNGATPCAPMNIINAATLGVGPAMELASGTGAASLLVENVNTATGRIDISSINFATNNFTLAPSQEVLFAIIEFPIDTVLARESDSFAGLNGVQVNFLSNSAVPDGNIVSDGVNTEIATTSSGFIRVEAMGNAQDRVGLFRPSNNFFFLDVTEPLGFQSGTDRFAVLGAFGDMPFVGNWAGNGKDHLGLHRKNSFARYFLDQNGDDRITAADRSFYMGAVTDIPIKGDWDGNGTDEVGLFRPSNNQFFLDTNNSGSITAADATFFMGASGDLPLIGDWNNDGVDEVGLFRPSNNAFFLDVNGDRRILAGDAVFGMGTTGDIPLVGDWNGDGRDNVGLFRPSSNRFFLDVNNSFSIGVGDTIFSMGAPGDVPIVGKW